MSSLINRIQRAFLGSAGAEKVRALLAELQVPAGGSGGSMREVRRGLLRPISHEATLRDALANMGLSGGGGGGAQALSSIRTAVLHNLRDSEGTLRDGLDGLLAPDDLEGDGGSGGAPDWVPASAKFHIDLVNDRAWTEADGEVAIDTLLGGDPNTESGWTVTSYDPANLTADGYVSTTGRLEVAAIGALRTKLLAGSTVALHTKQVGISSGYNSFAMLTDDAMSAVILTMDFADLISKAEAWSGTLALQTAASLVLAEDAFNTMAWTITPLRAELATNSSDAVAAVIGAAEFPVTGDHPMTAVLFSMNIDTALQAITAYDPLPNTSGLTELSVTVTP